MTRQEANHYYRCLSRRFGDAVQLVQVKVGVWAIGLNGALYDCSRTLHSAFESESMLFDEAAFKLPRYRAQEGLSLL